MLNKLPFLLLLGALVMGGCHAKGANLPLPEKFVNAEIQVESSGRNNAVGDDGKAIGCLQIHKACWKDAVAFDSSIGGSYTNCFQRAYSVKIMTAYLNRYCKDAIRQNDFEIMARTWNGGSNGAKNYKTKTYWRKVQAAMKN